MVKVSIIIPVYNTENFLDKCLSSLVNQTLKDIEIICVDDGSIDNSLEILRKYENLDARVKVITQENQKQGAARNNGMRCATGEFIGFVDSDDWVDENYYEKLYEAAKNNDADIALATNVRIGGNKKTKKRLNLLKEEFVTEMQEKFDICKLAKNPCPTNKIYKKTFLDKYQIYFPEKMYCEDKLFVTQAVYYANGVATAPDVNYYYFRNPSSTVNTRSKDHYEAISADKEKAKKDVLKFLKEQNAQIRDREFWAQKSLVKFAGIVLYKVMESLHTEKHLLLGLIPIKEKTV